MRVKGILTIVLATGLILIIALVTHTELGQSNTTKEPLFVYGTLKNPIVRLYACACLTEERQATLSGYRQDGLTIIPDSNSQVIGEILSVTPTELLRFDRYENTPNKYRREKVLIEDLETWVYIRN